MSPRWLVAVGLLVLVAAAVVVIALHGDETSATITPAPIDDRCAGAGGPEPSDDLRPLELVVWKGAGVTDAEVEAQLGRAAGYYALHGVALRRRGAVRAGEIVLNAKREDVRVALSRAGIDPSRPTDASEEARRITCRTVLAPVAAHLEDTRAIGGDAQVMFLRKLASPDAAVAALLPDLRGVTFSSHGELAVRGCYPADGIPLVLIGLDGIAKRRPGTADVTLAHELGHVLGLEHAAGQNLMATEPPSCVPWLTALQRAQVGQMLAPR